MEVQAGDAGRIRKTLAITTNPAQNNGTSNRRDTSDENSLPLPLRELRNFVLESFLRDLSQEVPGGQKPGLHAG